ncbi:hypothetical protein [Pinirhizobacter soli]|uniref:hypothetical protein n=1 Tax=Pinirhizobacter soli TaxID=2786953 RepID=UPI00202A4CF6|nr:hypothetical protein [Pinirhizobacter soli]
MAGTIDRLQSQLAPLKERAESIAARLARLGMQAESMQGELEFRGLVAPFNQKIWIGKRGSHFPRGHLTDAICEFLSKDPKRWQPTSAIADYVITTGGGIPAEELKSAYLAIRRQMRQMARKGYLVRNWDDGPREAHGGSCEAGWRLSSESMERLKTGLLSRHSPPPHDSKAWKMRTFR